MSRIGFLGCCASHHCGQDQACRQCVAQPLQQASAPFRSLTEQQTARGPHQVRMPADETVNQPEAASRIGAQRTPGEHQRHRVLAANQLRQAHTAAKARMQAESNFRQSEARAVAVAGDPKAAGECEFQPAAQTEAVNATGRGEGRLLNAVEDRVRITQCVAQLIGAFDVVEFADIKPGE